MRFYPPSDPCDWEVCITLAEHEIVREMISGETKVVGVACPWHVTAVADQIFAEVPEGILGYYIQRHVTR